MKFLLNLALLVVSAITLGFVDLRWMRHDRRDLGIRRGRRFTSDGQSILYRMDGGYPGQVNRQDASTIEPSLQSGTPATKFGQAVVIDATTQGVRPLSAGDSALDSIYGITVRPYPFQQEAATNFGAANIGAATPPAAGVIDILRRGYIMATLSGSAASLKGGRVFVWVAASSGAHVQGNFEAAGTTGSTIELDEKTSFNGPADPNGVVEIAFNL